MRRRQKGSPARTAWFVVAGLVAFMLVLAGCGGGGFELRQPAPAGAVAAKNCRSSAKERAK